MKNDQKNDQKAGCTIPALPVPGDPEQAAWEADHDFLTGLTAEELRAEAERRQTAHVMATLELGSRRAAETERLLALNPFQIGDWVTTARSRRNYIVREVNPRSVVVHGEISSFDRIDLDRVRPADPSRPECRVGVSEGTVAYLMGVRERRAEIAAEKAARAEGVGA